MVSKRYLKRFPMSSRPVDDTLLRVVFEYISGRELRQVSVVEVNLNEAVSVVWTPLLAHTGFVALYFPGEFLNADSVNCVFAVTNDVLPARMPNEVYSVLRIVY